MIKFALPVLFVSILAVPSECKKKSQSIVELETKTDKLVRGPWVVDELYHTISGKSSYYVRGGFNSTGIKYEKLRFVFNADGTGKTVQENGETYSTEWKFLTTDQRNLSLTVYDGNPNTYIWKLVEIIDNYLHATVPLVIYGNPNNIESFRLKQVKNE